MDPERGDPTIEVTRDDVSRAVREVGVAVGDVAPLP